MLDAEVPTVQDQIGDTNVTTLAIADDGRELFTPADPANEDAYLADMAWCNEMQRRDEEFDRLAALAKAEESACREIIDGMIQSNRELSALIAG